MENIKIIDLLNKIANGETPPKKIKYCNTICYYSEENQDYFVDGDMSLCSDYIRFALSDLNTDIEILEEDKKIEPLNVKSFEETPYFASNGEIMAIKINEIIDYINKENK